MRFRVEVWRRGSALVLALWLSLLLGAAGAAGARLAAWGAGGARAEAELALARAAAEGGIWAMAHRLAGQGAAERPPRTEAALSIGGVQVRVRATDEDGRVDVNAAPEALLGAMLRTSGLEADEAIAVARRITAWREAAAKRPSAMGLAETRFRTVAEMTAVAGLSPAVAQGVQAVATVHTGRAEPALDAAPPGLLPALDPQLASTGTRSGLRTPRRGGAGSSGRRTVWRIEAEARSGAVLARTGTVLTLMPADGVPGRILDWRPVGYH
jgi:general secretion pathway protein K